MNFEMFSLFAENSQFFCNLGSVSRAGSVPYGATSEKLATVLWETQDMALAASRFGEEGSCRMREKVFTNRYETKFRAVIHSPLMLMTLEDDQFLLDIFDILYLQFSFLMNSDFLAPTIAILAHMDQPVIPFRVSNGSWQKLWRTLNETWNWLEICRKRFQGVDPLRFGLSVYHDVKITSILAWMMKQYRICSYTFPANLNLWIAAL